MDKRGMVPLHLALRTGKKRIVSLLLSFRADVEVEGVIELATKDKHMTKLIKRHLTKLPGGRRKFRRYYNASREPIAASCVAEMPDDIRQLIDRTGIPEEILDKHFMVLLQCLRFTTSRKYTYYHQNKRKAPRHHRFEHTRTVPGGRLIEEGDPSELFNRMHLLGKGGFGRVYNCVRISDNKEVAIKKMPCKAEKERKLSIMETTFLKNYDHENIVKYYTCYEHKAMGEIWVIMELLKGGTLGEVARHCPLHETHIAYIAKGLLSGIEYLHSIEMVHRDLKSANVMLSLEADVKLIDFGLCMDVRAHGEVVSMVGSPYWIPPEMILHEPHSYPVDIWSFGICILELANRKLPFDKIALKCLFNVAVGEIPGLENKDKWTQDFIDFTESCLVRDPAKRLTATQLLDHPFIDKAQTRVGMQQFLHAIFVETALRRTFTS
eukprot:CAMPEP_0174269130 /NCGR_PEP_ID=MMETSP0439-20130205/39987_1 /TAXON_ID=0 /ORGANISM="Stereomyxa ramosa, Strain Chinc5" /LENGTH=436 /DNA_ID=CAMNT_0015357733 /DNA_START=653 /DNA_END=1963 /DNA_ORIENTATION=-